MLRTVIFIAAVASLVLIAAWRLHDPARTPPEAGRPSAANAPAAAAFSPPVPAASREIETIPYRAPAGESAEATEEREDPEVPSAEAAARPAGSLRNVAVVVRHSAGPVPSGTAWLLVRGGEAPPEELDWRQRQGVRRELLDLDGAAVFSGVPVGSCLVGLDLGQGLVRESEVLVREGRGQPGVVFTFGDSALEGRILDAEGRPAAGARVQAAFAVRAGKPVTAAWTVAGPDGRYRLPDLPAGRCVLAACIAGTRWTAEGRHERRIDLEAGTERFEDVQAAAAGTPPGR